MFSLLVTVLIILVVCGGFALLFKYSPIPEPFKSVGMWICLVIAFLWLLYALLNGWRIPLRL